MKIYLAGSDGVERRREDLRPHLIDRRLISYHYIGDLDKAFYFCQDFKDMGGHVMLDSGAFSAWTQKKKIRIADYILLLKKYSHFIDHYYNLDSIGNAERTWKNQRHMEAAGLKPMPVFHKGEDKKWLKLCLDNYEYFAVGGLVGTEVRTLCRYLDGVFKYIGKKPENKIHALGVAANLVLRRYPWYSADASTWVQFAFRGKTILPTIRGKNLDFSKLIDVHCSVFSRYRQSMELVLEQIGEMLCMTEKLDLHERNHRELINCFCLKQYQKTFGE